MNRKVARQFGHLQNDFNLLIGELDKEKPEHLETSPAPGKWSVTQVMHHLNRAETLSVIYVTKKRLAAPQLRPTGMEAALRLIFAKISFYLPLKYSAPNLLGDMPSQVTYQEIKASWTVTRQNLKALLDSLADEELKKPIFRQPFFGRWNIFQMLGFMQTHFNRHRKQMFRALNSAKAKS